MFINGEAKKVNFFYINVASHTFGVLCCQCLKHRRWAISKGIPTWLVPTLTNFAWPILSANKLLSTHVKASELAYWIFSLLYDCKRFPILMIYFMYYFVRSNKHISQKSLYLWLTPNLFVWIQLLCFFWINNWLCCLVKTGPRVGQSAVQWYFPL